MMYGRMSVLRYAIPVMLVGLGIMVFLPGDDRASVSAGAAIAEGQAEMRPSYLMAAPELIAELDAALEASPTLVTETMAREAMLPDPSVGATAKVAVAPTIDEEEAVGSAVDPAKAVQVGSTAVNLRAGPSKSTARLATLQPGQALTLGEMSNNWVQVTTADGISGWVYSRYVSGAGLDAAAESDSATQNAVLREPEPDREPAQQFSRHARITGDVVMRAGPSRNAQRLFVLPAGERVGIAEVDGRWARVVLRSGASGWVMIR